MYSLVLERLRLHYSTAILHDRMILFSVVLPWRLFVNNSEATVIGAHVSSIIILVTRMNILRQPIRTATTGQYARTPVLRDNKNDDRHRLTAVIVYS